MQILYEFFCRAIINCMWSIDQKTICNKKETNLFCLIILPKFDQNILTNT